MSIRFAAVWKNLVLKSQKPNPNKSELFKMLGSVPYKIFSATKPQKKFYKVLKRCALFPHLTASLKPDKDRYAGTLLTMLLKI